VTTFDGVTIDIDYTHRRVTVSAMPLYQMQDMSEDGRKAAYTNYGWIIAQLIAPRLEELMRLPEDELKAMHLAMFAAPPI
jgi:hypothetical protein